METVDENQMLDSELESEGIFGMNFSTGSDLSELNTLVGVGGLVIDAKQKGKRNKISQDLLVQQIKVQMERDAILAKEFKDLGQVEEDDEGEEEAVAVADVLDGTGFDKGGRKGPSGAYNSDNAGTENTGKATGKRAKTGLALPALFSWDGRRGLVGSADFFPPLLESAACEVSEVGHVFLVRVARALKRLS